MLKVCHIDKIFGVAKYDKKYCIINMNESTWETFF